MSFTGITEWTELVGSLCIPTQKLEHMQQLVGARFRKKKMRVAFQAANRKPVKIPWSKTLWGAKNSHGFKGWMGQTLGVTT